jgi:predicted nuclease of predicted toxin-antitoxin system
MSPATANYLIKRFKIDAIDLVSLGLGHLKDPDVIEFAKREGSVLITFDLNFGQIYH